MATVKLVKSAQTTDRICDGLMGGDSNRRANDDSKVWGSGSLTKMGRGRSTLRQNIRSLGLGTY